MMPLTFAESVRLALHDALKDPKTILMGEGVPDPKGVFGTTKGLKEAYPGQVFDQPVSEAGATGVLIGTALNGFKCIQTHQRIDFSLYAMDQIVNNAAKWDTMFGGNGGKINLTIRMIVGRGWGQGVQHSQNLESLYAHIPGLKVFVPHDPESAYRLLTKAINDDSPVIFLEHKWIYNKKTVTNKPRWSNPELTVVSWGAASSEVELAIKDMEHIDHIVIEEFPEIDWDTISRSLGHHQRLLVVSDDWGFGSLSSQIVTTAKPKEWARIGFPHKYVPASPHRSIDYYPNAKDIVLTINNLTRRNYKGPEPRDPHDVDPFLLKFTSAL